MRYFFYAALLIVALILETTLLRLFTVLNVTPDLLLIAVVFISLREGQLNGMLFGFPIGLLDDLTTADLVGLSALTKTIIGFIAGIFYGSKSGFRSRFLGVVLLFCAAVQEVTYGIIVSFAPDQNLWTTLFRYGIPRVVYTGMLGFLIFILIPKQTWKIGLPEWFEEKR